jgi:hypothetical protein
MKILELFVSQNSSKALLDIKTVLSSALDAEMPSEVTEILTDMSDLLAQSFSQLQ